MALSDEQGAFDGLQFIILYSLQSEIKEKLSSFQEIACITAILDKKIKSLFCVSGVLRSLPRSTVQIKQLRQLRSFFSWNPRRKTKKLTKNYISIRWLVKYVVYICCCYGHLKHFLENYRFCQKSENEVYNTG